MYGTIARVNCKPGKVEEFRRFEERTAQENPPAGLVFVHMYQLDDAPDELMLVVGFTDREAYVANANSPQQQQEYETYRTFLAAEPEWHDGEIIQSLP